jgi:2-iminoacetate synthase ThiH
MRKNRWILLVVIAVLGTFATAQKAQLPPQQLDAAQLDKLAAAPSLEQAILRLAAEKSRQEKKPMPTLELQMTVRVKMTNACPIFCAFSGNTLLTCWEPPCNSPV